MEQNLKWHSGYKTKGQFRITLREDVIYKLCMETVLSEIKRHTGFQPVLPVVAQSGEPTQTVWFEMEKVDYGTEAPEVDLFKVVRYVWFAMSNVYGPIRVEMEGLSCLPFFNIEKLYEDED